jgi:hypothetical protein
MQQTSVATAPASQPPDSVSLGENVTGAAVDARHNRVGRTNAAVARFVGWLDRYGETSFDFQTVYAGRYGRLAKSIYYRNKAVGTMAVAPLVFCEAFVPDARTLCWTRQRFPIADAHYAMAFARRFHATGDRADYERAVHFLDTLLASRIETPTGLGWGYPFDWETIYGTIPSETPLITTLPYVYEAFESVYAIDKLARWADVMGLIAEHALHDFPSHAWRGDGASCSYTPMPGDNGRVVNANAYRAFLLTRAWYDLGHTKYLDAAQPNLQFVMDVQNPDGSWYYAIDGRRAFIDHFHTCFVLKALLKIEVLTGDGRCTAAIDSGLRYYLANLFDAEGLPRPFAKPPRFTFYRRELYDYAEAINLLTLARPRAADAEHRRGVVVEDILSRWQQRSGCFRTRQLLFGWDNVPMHRWAQSQLLRSLCGLLNERD